MQNEVMNEFFFQSQDDDHSQRSCFQNDHLGNWSPGMDCCRRLTFRQPVRTDSEDGFRTGCRNVSRQQQSFSGLQSPDDHFNQGMLLLCSNHFHSQAFISKAFEFCRIKPDGDILQTRCQKNEKVRRLLDCETDHSLIVTFSDFLTSWQKEISIHRRHLHIHILSHAKWSCDVSMCKMCPQIFRSLNERR